MKIQFTSIKVDDLEASISFYTGLLGLTQAMRFQPQPGVDIAFLKDATGGTLELVANAHEPLAAGPSRVSICFAVESVDRELPAFTARGVKIVRGPIALPTGAKFVYLLDPNGVEIGLLEGFAP